jgi:ParB family transcriptional regulator, chromosome partitioning protein
MARRSGLGKGLQALIPGEHSDADGTGPSGLELRELRLEAIRPNPFQPRTHFDEAALADLAASIQEVGVLQPILVRAVPTNSNEFELVAGERRWRSARKAGLETIPAIVQDGTSDLHSLEVALIENLHRTDLNPLEEAAAYQQLIDDFDLTHEQVAARVSRSRQTITNMLRILTLPPSVQGEVAEGRLTAGHAKALGSVIDPLALEEAAAKVVREGLSVRATEELVRRVNQRGPEPAPEAPSEPPPPTDQLHPKGDAGVKELEQLLSDHLDTTVRVHLAGMGGNISIRFADLDDLERVYRSVIGTSQP